MERIVTAFSNRQVSIKIKDILLSNGMHVYKECSSGAELLRLLPQEGVGIVICNYILSDMNALKLREFLPMNYTMLVLVSNYQSSLYNIDGLFYIVSPLNKMDLISSIKMVNQINKKFISYKEKIDKLEDDLDRIKIVERAKGFLMDKFKMSEAEAHKYLQKRSMDSSLKIVDLAKKILE